MSLLEKIIFVADFIEPGRKDLVIMSGVRKAAFIDIDQALLWNMWNPRDIVLLLPPSGLMNSIRTR